MAGASEGAESEKGLGLLWRAESELRRVVGGEAPVAERVAGPQGDPPT